MIRLGANYRLARMLEREDFRSRMAQPADFRPRIALSAAAGLRFGGAECGRGAGRHRAEIQSVGGREIQREYGQPPQVALTMPILVGLDGQRKMSKSLGNYVGITEAPQEMFGKLMSISDELMWSYYELVTDWTPKDIAALKEEVRWCAASH